MDDRQPALAVFLHDVSSAAEGTSTRAAFVHGMASRTVLLDFLPFRGGLLALRGCSRSCKLLVSQCKLRTQTRLFSKQIPAFRSPTAALAAVNAFACAASLRAQWDEKWTHSDVAACAHPVLIFEDTNSSVPNECPSSLLRVLRNVSQVALPAHRLTDDCFDSLRATTTLHLNLSKLQGPLTFHWRSMVTLGNLRTLALRDARMERDRVVTAAALAPIADRLESLSLLDCYRLADFKPFVSLKSLAFEFDYGSTAGPFDFSALPMSLEKLTVKSVNFEHSGTRSFGPPGSTPCLQDISISDICNFRSLPWMECLPESLQSLKVDVSWDDNACFTDADMTALGRLTALRALSLDAENRVTLTVTAAQLNSWKSLEDLRLCGNFHVPDVTLFSLPNLKKLECWPDVIGMSHYTTPSCMPALRILNFDRDVDYSERVDLRDLQTLILLHPTLREVTFDVYDKDEVRPFIKALAKVYLHPLSPARLWWLLSTETLAYRTDVPLSIKQEAKDNEGWVRLSPESMGWCQHFRYTCGIRMEGRAGDGMPAALTALPL